jgi:hypothetical protein
MVVVACLAQSEITYPYDISLTNTLSNLFERQVCNKAV